VKLKHAIPRSGKMNKIRKEIAALIVLLILVFLWALSTQTSVNTSTIINTSMPVNAFTPVNASTIINTSMPVNASTPVNNTSTPVNTTPDPESQVGGMAIQFKDGISESEVKAILQNYSMTRNYRITYDTNYTEKYYIMVDKDKITDIQSKLEKEKTWTEPTPVVEKGNYYIITISERVIHNQNFIMMLSKYNLQLEKFVWCDIRFLYNNGPLAYWIPKEDAIRIKNELERNQNIFIVRLSYIYSS
jgi:hypothetical protein